MKKIIFAFSVFGVLISYMSMVEGEETMKLTSPAFANNQFIPKKFTCEGEDINPALFIDDIPKGAESFALIVDDPDAPMGTWVHWVVFDIPLTNRIEEDSVPGKLGMTNSGRKDFHGPCPPSGTHRYVFKIYCLDTLLNLKEGVNKGQVEHAMQGHILGKAELIGLYQRNR